MRAVAVSGEMLPDTLSARLILTHDYNGSNDDECHDDYNDNNDHNDG